MTTRRKRLAKPEGSSRIGWRTPSPFGEVWFALDEAEAAYRRGHEMGNAYGTVGLKVVEGRRKLLEQDAR